jgi:hypothetical protein
VVGVATGVFIRSDAGPSSPDLSYLEIARNGHHGIYVYMNGETPATVDHCTLVDNFDHGVYVFDGTIELTNTNITHNGKNGIRAYLSTPSVSYCNVFMNPWAPDQTPVPPIENYAGMDDLTGIDGNVSVEPYYCGFSGTGGGYDYQVCLTSDILTLGEGGTYIGAWDGACSDCVAPVEFTSWGAIKALYK